MGRGGRSGCLLGKGPMTHLQSMGVRILERSTVPRAQCTRDSERCGDWLARGKRMARKHKGVTRDA